MKRLSVLLLSVLLTVVARAEDSNKNAAASAKPVEHKPGDVVARVGKTEIKWLEVDDAAKSFAKEYSARGQVIPESAMGRLHYDVLNEMVTREIVLQQAVGHEQADLDAQVKAQVEGTKQQAGGEESLNKALADMGITLADYTKRVREGLMIQDLIKKVVDAKDKVTPEDAKKFYDENPSQFVVPERVRASHILILIPDGASDEVKTQKLTQIKAALTLVKGGTPFAEVAAKYSEDKGSAKRGGDLDFFARGRMVPEFETMAFSLKTNEVSEIVTTQFGYHIIKVTDRKPAGQVSYAEAQPDIENYLKKTQGQKIAKEYVEGLRTSSKYEILLPEPPALDPSPRMMAPGARPPTSAQP